MLRSPDLLEVRDGIAAIGVLRGGEDHWCVRIDFMFLSLSETFHASLAGAIDRNAAYDVEGPVVLARRLRRTDLRSL
jgi:hypothetical protein